MAAAAAGGRRLAAAAGGGGGAIQFPHYADASSLEEDRGRRRGEDQRGSCQNLIPSPRAARDPTHPITC